MKLLLDMCVPVGIVDDLVVAGHDVVHVRSLDPRASDEWILSRAREERRVAVTMDLDFGDIMSHIQRASPSVVLMRLRNPPALRAPSPTGGGNADAPSGAVEADVDRVIGALCSRLG